MAHTHFLVALCSLVLVSLAIDGVSAYEQKPKTGFLVQKPKTGLSVQLPKVEVTDLFKYKSIGVQGIIYCKSGSKLVPLQGAVARVTCVTIEKTLKDGKKSAPLTVLSKSCDKKGYFFATLPITVNDTKSKLYECKAFLHSSSVKTCDEPTNVNKGIDGAIPWAPFKLVADQKMKVYSVGPFVYTSKNAKKTDGGH